MEAIRQQGKRTKKVKGIRDAKKIYSADNQTSLRTK